MNTTLLTIVKQIIADYGEGILENPQRLKAFFSDLAKDEPKPLRIAFGRCVENGAYSVLKTAPDAAERASRKVAIAQRLRDDAGLDPAISGEALDILEAALFQDAGPTSTVIPPKSKAPENPLPVVPTAQNATSTPAREKKILRNVLIVAGVVIVGLVVALTIALFQPSPPVLQTPAVATPTPTPAPATPAAAPPPQRPIPANMVHINGGTFMMGSPSSEIGRWDEEGPQHQVTVSGFYMGKYEVTQQEYQEVMGINHSNFKGPNLPVEMVSWYDAVEYCNKRSQREGLTSVYTINGSGDYRTVTWNRNANGYRLPTEAEWEYACRAGTTTPFNTGNNITTNQANYDGDFPYNNNAKGESRGKTTAVGSFAPNRWGLYDMHGNVDEWCWDWYGNYSSGAQTDPVGAFTGHGRVQRGSTWNSLGVNLRSAFRSSYTPSYRSGSIYRDSWGFRLVRNE